MARSSDSAEHDYQERMRAPRRYLPTQFTEEVRPDGSVKVHVHTPTVPARKMKRAKRILWELRNREGGYRPAEFFKHPELRGVPYLTLKGLWRESEGW